MIHLAHTVERILLCSNLFSISLCALPSNNLPVSNHVILFRDGLWSNFTTWWKLKPLWSKLYFILKAVLVLGVMQKLFGVNAFLSIFTSGLYLVFASIEGVFSLAHGLLFLLERLFVLG